MAWRCSGRSHDELVSNLASARILRNPRAIAAIRAVDRANYLPDRSPSTAYMDAPQSIGFNATISAPHMHAYALEHLCDFVQPGASVLDVGSGSGYLVSCLAVLAGENGKVVGIEHLKELVEQSVENVRRDHPEFLGDGRVRLIAGDGRQGFAECAPYDAIHVGAAAWPFPQHLVDQLKAPGRLVCPIGPPDGDQALYLVDKYADGSIHKTELMGVRYVPLSGVEHYYGR
ncbi:protein-L-isoaspartate O-methyltransferase 1 [Cladochytrium replicatum]|nr:protein-L-isoaspartate O-methyltransferase 1 [Cladochytrium replicatum]